MKKVIKDDVVEQLLRRYNPFGLRSKQGTPYEFNRISEVYLFLMVKVYTLSPRGYIELPLLLNEIYYHLSFNECKAMAQIFMPLGLKDVQLVDYQSVRGKLFFESLFKGLHIACETTFDNSSFIEAYRLFKNRMEIEKAKKKQDESV